MILAAGQATARKVSGGNVVISAGEGSNTYQYDGGRGGVVQIFGGAAQGGHEADHGGNVEFTGELLIEPPGAGSSDRGARSHPRSFLFAQAALHGRPAAALFWSVAAMVAPPPVARSTSPPPTQASPV